MLKNAQIQRTIVQLSFANASVLRLWKGTKHLIKIIGLEETKE